MQQLSREVKVTRVLNGAVAGTTEQDGSAIDMANFRSVMFLSAFGTITSGAATSVKLQQGTTSSPTEDLLGSSVTVADTDDNHVVVHDLSEAIERYVRVVILRATQNAVIDGVFAIQYNPRKMPTTDDTTTVISRKVLVSPIAGTA